MVSKGTWYDFSLLNLQGFLRVSSHLVTFHFRDLSFPSLFFLPRESKLPDTSSFIKKQHLVILEVVFLSPFLFATSQLQIVFYLISGFDLSPAGFATIVQNSSMTWVSFDLRYIPWKYFSFPNLRVFSTQLAISATHNITLQGQSTGTLSKGDSIL